MDAKQLLPSSGWVWSRKEELFTKLMKLELFDKFFNLLLKVSKEFSMLIAFDILSKVLIINPSKFSSISSDSKGNSYIEKVSLALSFFQASLEEMTRK